MKNPEWSERSKAFSARIGQRIRALRLERGMTLAQVGGDELSRAYLSLVERGHTRVSLQTLMIVADRLDTRVSDLVD